VDVERADLARLAAPPPPPRGSAGGDRFAFAVGVVRGATLPFAAS